MSVADIHCNLHHLDFN